MNIPEILDSEKICRSLEAEEKILEARLAAIRSSEVSSKLKEISELSGRLKLLLVELAELQKGTLLHADEENGTSPSKARLSGQGSEKKPRRSRVSKEDAHKAILVALTGAPEHTMTRAALAEKTGLAKPKIDEGIKFNASKFEVGRGPGATIKLLPSDG